MIQQEIFPIKYDIIYAPEDFIISSSNKAAHHAIINHAQKWGVAPYPNTLLISAPPSSGKTYLTKILSLHINTKCIIQNELLSGNDIIQYDAFVIDNFDESWNEEAVLHHFNLLHEHKKLLLITTSYDIHNIDLPDLASRIKSIHNIKIGTPDDQFIEMFIFKQFAHYSIKTSPNIIKYIAHHIPRECNKITQTIEKINQHAIRHKKKISINLIKESQCI